VAADTLVLYLGRRGGGARHAVETARALAQAATRVHLVYREDGELADEFADLRLPGAAVRTVRQDRMLRGTLDLARAVAAVRRYFRSTRVAAVLVPMWSPWDLPFLRVAAAAGAPVLLTVHDAFFHPGEQFRAAERLLHAEIRRADGLLVLSEYTNRQLERVPGASDRRWRAELAVPTPGGSVTSMPRRRAAGARLRLVLPGRLLRYKGVDVFCLLVQRLRAAGVPVVAEIAGSGPALTPALHDLADQAGITLTDRWLSEDELIATIARHDLVVLPYREATQSGIIPLAYSLGIPVVATRVGGLAEQVQDEQTGLTCDADELASLVAAVRRLHEDVVLYATCSEGALQRARGDLGWPAATAVVAHALSALRASPPRPELELPDG
jgi:glycosyltransferase involved in cell wall biosynthesis